MLRNLMLLGLLVAAFAVFFHAYNKLGYNVHYKKHHPGQCRQVTGLNYGAEDIGVTGDGLAFVTSGVHFAPASTGYTDFLTAKNIKGGIYLYDFKKPSLGARALKIRPSKNFDLGTFHPHGISVLEDKVKGEHLLYVVNHPRGGDDRVEKFKFSPGINELTHIRFFNDSKFHITNDLAVFAEDKFYISNFYYFKNMFLGQLENYLPNTLCSVLFVDGNDVREVTPGLHAPNGVTLSKDKKHLYVALPLANTMHVYEVQKDNALKLVQDVTEVYTFIDNFHLSQDGSALFAGAHPIAHKVMAHLGDPNIQAPSSILHLPLSNGLVDTDGITELFYDHGDLISGSTVGFIHSNQLLIGSVINKLAVCDLPVAPAAKAVPGPK